MHFYNASLTAMQFCSRASDEARDGTMDTPQYKMSMYKKQTLYQQEGKRLISIYQRDPPGLDGVPATKLRHHGFTI